jgi:Gas vesicle synthesis protein GvpL/GvpF
MKRLLHCVFRHDGTDVPEVVQNRRLAVETSPWIESEPPNMARLLAYENSIAQMHATRTVVPLRFGCVKDDESQILQLLDEHEAEFERLLGQLDGLVEMGLRVWRKFAGEEPGPLSVGARYLAATRARHAGLTLIEDQWARGICGSLGGFYVREKREARPGPEGRLVSLHFLVARAAAEDFRERVRQMTLPGEMKFLVSGPWPPYNFVDHA